MQIIVVSFPYHIRSKKAIAQVVSNTLKLSDKKISGLSKSELENISYALKNMHFNIIETGDFKEAQVTNGGIS